MAWNRILASTVQYSLASINQIRTLLKREIYRIKTTIYHGLKHIIETYRNDRITNDRIFADLRNMIQVLLTLTLFLKLGGRERNGTRGESRHGFS